MRKNHLQNPQKIRFDNPQANARNWHSDSAAAISSAFPGERRGALRPEFARLEGEFHETGPADINQRPLSLRRQRPPGCGRADGSTFRHDGGCEPHRGPRFDVQVEPGGYVWWYLDGLSADGRYGFSIIAFIGSVFSPYYYWKSRRDPLDHCAINVALYGPGASRWTMTERGRQKVQASARHFQVGPSQLRWTGDELIVDINEWSMPLPRPVSGQIRLKPRYLSDCAVALAAGNVHRWWPIAPSADVSVEFENPSLNWQGEGYFDSNAGDFPLEEHFASWDWARSECADVNRILYDVNYRDGSSMCLGLAFDVQGRTSEFNAPPKSPLPRAFWRVNRDIRSEEPAELIKTLEDTPFYTRSVVTSTLEGTRNVCVHESLDLNRFRSPIVKLMLPFRMPRLA